MLLPAGLVPLQCSHAPEGCLPGWAVLAPARLRSRSPERGADRNMGGTDATATAEEGSGEEKRAEIIISNPVY